MSINTILKCNAKVYSQTINKIICNLKAIAKSKENWKFEG